MEHALARMGFRFFSRASFWWKSVKLIFSLLHALTMELSYSIIMLPPTLDIFQFIHVQSFPPLLRYTFLPPLPPNHSTTSPLQHPHLLQTSPAGVTYTHIQSQPLPAQRRTLFSLQCSFCISENGIVVCDNGILGSDRRIMVVLDGSRYLLREALGFLGDA